MVCGPTASGKTALAVSVARHFNTQIISADSRQFYRETEIGTAKPSAEELAIVTHHFINSNTIFENFSVADFEKAALAKLEELFQSNPIVVMVGGSGLYLQAIYQGFDDIPESDVQERRNWNQFYQEKGLTFLQEQLLKLDPEYYNIVDLQNPQRIIRALEVSSFSGKPFSSFLSKKKKERDFEIIKIGLNPDRKILYDRINYRVDQMTEKGLIKEARQLLPYRHLNALNTVGYKELFDAFEQNTDVKEALEKIKQNTRRFAKRQITWFKKDGEIKWFVSAEVEPVLDYINCSIGL